MRTPTLALAITAALAICPRASLAESTKIDLRTREGVSSIKGQWRFANAQIVEIDNTGPPPERKAIKTYSVEPKAGPANFDDSQWEIVDPTTLKNPRSTGRVCFAWYRIKITLPEGVEGKTVSFVTTVDDYGEVWVDGKLPRKVGQSGGSVVAGFNTPNRVTLPEPKPGKTYSIAIFAMNGPISDPPTNYIFLRDTFLEIADVVDQQRHDDE